MAKYWLRLFLLIGSVIGIFALIGSLLPRSFDFSTSIVIHAPREQVFPLLDRLESWPQWSRQWNTKEIEELEITYNDVEQGVGAAQSWKDRRGEGKLWITESTKNESIAFDMDFANFPRMTSRMELTELADEDGPKTKVQWSSKGKLPGGPLYGVMAPFFSDQMMHEYDKSLQRLKEIAEAQAQAQAKTETDVKDKEKVKPAAPSASQ